MIRTLVMDGIQSLKRKWDLLGYKKQKNQLQNFFGFHMSEEEYLELGDSVKSVLGNNDTAKILENWSENLGCEDLAKARVFLDVFGLISFGHDAKINLSTLDSLAVFTISSKQSKLMLFARLGFRSKLGSFEIHAKWITMSQSTKADFNVGISLISAFIILVLLRYSKSLGELKRKRS